MENGKLKKIIAVLMCIVTMTFAAPDLSGVNNVAAATSKVRLDYTQVTMSVRTKVRLHIKGTKKKVIWRSSNKKIAKVSKTGKVTALKVGKCKIIAKVSGKKYKCSIVVKKRTPVTPPKASTKPFTKITLDAKELKINLVKTKYYKDGSPYLSDEKSICTLKVLNTKKKAAWESSNRAVATVNSKGKVTAVAAGKCTISAKIAGTKYKCKLTVTDIKNADKVVAQKYIYDMLKLVNKDRVAAKVRPLKIKDNLNKVADIRVKEVSSSPENFSHTRPNGKKFATAYKDAKVKTGRFMGENVAYAEDKVPYMDTLVKLSFKTFFKSELHRKTMENPVYEYLGVGYFYEGSDHSDHLGNRFMKTYWVLEFYAR